MLDIGQLLWDAWNMAHIARHAVTPQEVEEACNQQAHVSQTYDQRLRVIGATGQGRVLTLILAPKEDTRYYPVTARPASRKERQLFEHYRSAA